MSEESGSAMVKSPLVVLPDMSAPSRTEQTAEVAVFLFLILPSILLSPRAGSGDASFTLTAASAILRDLALLSLVLFFLWRNREPLARIGWSRRDPWREVGLGLLLFTPMFFGTAWLAGLLKAAGLSGPTDSLPAFLTPRGPAQTLLAVALVTVVAVAEETVFRGYLILRLHSATAARTAAVLLSCAIFALGHGYEGAAGMITVGMMGLIFALIYLWRRSLLAPIVMHFLQDFMGLVVLPWAMRR